GEGGRLPLVGGHSGNRQEHALSNEESGVMIITKRHLARRTVLRGMGATIALPLLDAMVPAFAAPAATAPIRRFGAMYVAMGMSMPTWLQPAEGPLQMNVILQPLEPFRDRLVVASGLDSEGAVSVGDNGNHPRAQ